MTAYRSRADRDSERALYGPVAWLLQPSYWAVRVYRFGQRSKGRRTPVAKLQHALYFALYSIVRLVTGIDIPRGAHIGHRLMIHHFGGIIIHPRARIGDDCVLRHGVTVGERSEGGGVPDIGDGVVFGSYAQVLGPIHVGDGARIGSMSVVLSDVPPGATAVGAPARVLERRHAAD